MTWIIKKFIIHQMYKKVYSLLITLLFFLPAVFSQTNIFRIDIEGNKLISNATIISKIKIRAGQEYNENVVNSDVKNLYATGYFDFVKVEKQETAEGIVVVFKVQEKPVIKEISFEGNKRLRKKQLGNALDIKEGVSVDEYKLKEAVNKIKDLYTKKGFTQAEVTYNSVISENNEAHVTFVINEHEVLKVRDIQAEGNKAFSDRRIIKVMKTRPAWLFNRGIFKEEVLTDDIKRIKDFYMQEGYSDVKVDVDVKKGVDGIHLAVSILEGPRYYIGEIKIEGNQKITSEEIEKVRELKKDNIYNEQVIYEEASRIRELYMDRGYIFSQVDPLSYYNLQTQKVDITFKITENKIASVEEIHIRGNTKTKDKVIRRELRIFPGEKFEGSKVKKSKQKLENLGFFEEIRFGTEAGSAPEMVDLVVDVKEAKTGYLSFGGGYSSIDEFLGFVELRQRNFDYRNWKTFTGAGQDISLMASMGTLSDHYQLSFTNPWILDTPYSFGFDAYKKGHQREENVGYAYEEDVRGGMLRLGREFNDYINTRLAYKLERVEISDVIAEATQDLKDEAGINNLSTGEVSLNFDTRDNVFVPSRGIYFSNTFSVTGGVFGGDKDFTKYFSKLSLYFPLVNKSVIELRFSAGVSDPFDNTDEVPIYERFFAGGASTIRGYQERKIGPIDAATDDPIGGEAIFVNNIEYTYPLTDFFKLATFFDSGNVWRRNSDFFSDRLFKSIGLGFRVKTPIGPINIDYGWPLDLEPGEEKKEGRFHFSVSREF